MKKFFAIALAAIIALSNVATLSAQMVGNINVEKEAKALYGSKWTRAAQLVAEENELTNDGKLVYTKTIQAPGMSQKDLYYEMSEWFICNYQNAIQMADKEDGIIVARPCVHDIATVASGWNAYKVDICPLIRVEVTDGQVDITYTLQDYGVAENVGGGNACTAVACGLMAGALVATVADATCSTHVVEHHYGYHHTVIERTYCPRPHHLLTDALLVCAVADLASGSHYDEGHAVWPIDQCYPFCNKDKHKKVSAKAFVVANTYSQVVMDNIEAAINQCQLAYSE